MPHAGNKSKKKRDHAEELRKVQAKWDEYLSKFKDAETCLATFFDTVGVSLYACPKCGSVEVEKFNGARTIKCKGCKHTQWVTAGTFFHRVRLPLVWFGALWLLSQGVSFNGNQLHKVAGIAPSTGWKIFKKVTLALAAQLEENARSVPTGAFDNVVCRRTCKTPADVHPRDEDSEVEKSETETMDDSLGELSEQELMVLELLSAMTLNFDQLAARTELDINELNGILLMLEVSGLVKRIPGGWYQSNLPKWRLQRELETGVGDKTMVILEQTIDYVKSTFHGVSRKYLQLFVAAYSCFADRKRWTLGALLRHCLDVGEISLQEIRSYATPAHVQLGNVIVAAV